MLRLGGFDYTNHESMPVLENVRRPVLALYGNDDRAIPLVESARDLIAAVERDGRRRVTVRYFPGVDHLMRIDGAIAPGSIETTANWIHGLPRLPAEQVAGPVPDQILEATAPPLNPAYASATILIAGFAVQAVGYLAGLVAAVVKRRRHYDPVDIQSLAQWIPVRSSLRWLAAAGIASVVFVNMLIGTEIALAITETYTALPLHVGWGLTRIAAIATVALGVLAVDHTISARSNGWDPDLAKKLTVVGVLSAATVQTINNAYLGIFTPGW